MDHPKRSHDETGITPEKLLTKRPPSKDPTNVAKNLFGNSPSGEPPEVPQNQAAIDAENHADPPQEKTQAQSEVQAQPNAEPAPAPTSPLETGISCRLAHKKFVEIKTEIDKLKKTLEEVRRENPPMQKHLDEVTKNFRELENSIRELIEELQEEMNDLQDEKKTKKRMRDLERTMQGLQNELDNLPETSDIQPSAMGDKEDKFPLTDTDLMWMKMALMVASRAEISEYAKGKPSVGCVIRRSRSKGPPAVLAVGWNGFPPKTKEDILRDKAAEYDRKGKKHGLTNELGLHAEVNALRNCSENPEKATVYVTHVPCHECAKQLISHRVKRVFYLFWMDDYTSSIELFQVFDISCIPFSDSSRNDVLDDFSKTFLDRRKICVGSTKQDIPKENSFHLSTKDSTSGTSDLKRSVSGDYGDKVDELIQEFHKYRNKVDELIQEFHKFRDQQNITSKDTDVFKISICDNDEDSQKMTEEASFTQ